jgi:hypothetical protein
MTTDMLTSAMLTSAAGPMLHSGDIAPICVSGKASVQGTISRLVSPYLDWLCLSAQTNSGYTTAKDYYHSDSRAAIMELRRLTGLTWEQLSRLFGLTRRSLHLWAVGKPMSATNEEHLQRLLATLRSIDRGTARGNRSLLLGVMGDGTVPFDLLVEKEYDRVIKQVGLESLRARRRPRRLPHGGGSHIDRQPHELVGALQEPVHEQKGHLLSASPIQTRRTE